MHLASRHAAPRRATLVPCLYRSQYEPVQAREGRSCWSAFLLFVSLSSNVCGQSPDQDTSPFACTAAFPWHLNSLENDLFKGGGASNDELKADVQAMVREWGGSVLAGSAGCAYVFLRDGSARRVDIPRFSKDKVGSYILVKSYTAFASNSLYLKRW